MSNIETPGELIVSLCKQFYDLGWVTGTGGGMSIRENQKVYIAPSGVQKERMHSEDMYVLDFVTGDIVKKPTHNFKISACTPLFWTCYKLRPKTYACIHSHSINAVLATLLCESHDYLKITHLEMIKGIRKGESLASFRYEDELIIPIIENTSEEEDLQETLALAISTYPDTNAVLVRRHGVYIWGESWEKAKSMAECYDYLFECYVRMKQMGIDPSALPMRKFCQPKINKLVWERLSFKFINNNGAHHYNSEKINDSRRRQVTFVRRKFGLMKKAYELAVLCECDVALMMITPEQKLYLYSLYGSSDLCSSQSMQDMVLKYNDITACPDDCELLGDDDMARLIERGKEGVEEHFGNDIDEYDDEDEKEDYIPDKKTRKRSSISDSSSAVLGKKAKANSANAADPVFISSSEQRLSSVGAFPPVTAPTNQSQDEMYNQGHQPHFMAPPYYYATSAPQGYPQNFMPYHPYMLYPHPSYGNQDGGEDGSKSSSTNNSALHLPPLPFAFAHPLHPDGSTSTQSLHPKDVSASSSSSHLQQSASSMFASSGMYYPFGAPWPLPTLNSSSSTGELRQNSSNMDLIAAAATAESREQKIKDINDEICRSELDETTTGPVESMKMKEVTTQEEETKSQQKIRITQEGNVEHVPV